MQYVCRSSQEAYRSEVSRLRPPVEPQTLPPAPPTFQYMSGLDKLKVSLWLDWSSGDFKLGLQEAKENLQLDHDQDEFGNDLASIEFDDGTRFNVQRTGAGKYPYALKSGDITLLFSNHKSDGLFPNCRVEIGSVSCWSPGWSALFDRILDWLAGHGGTVRKQKITEVHLAADLFGVKYRDTGFADEDRWTARANKGGIHFNHFVRNYISFGKGAFMLRVYDKTGELKPGSPKDEFFREFWAEHSGGEAPEYVTRVEFQLRREVIGKFNIDTVYDLSTQLNSLWAYCTVDWCRFCERPISASDRKNKNHQRYKADSVWEQVRGVRFNPGRTLTLKRNKVRMVDIDGLKKQMAGCALSICAAFTDNPEAVYPGWTSIFGAGQPEEHIMLASDMIRDQIRENYRKDREGYIRKIETKRNAAHIIF